MLVTIIVVLLWLVSLVGAYNVGAVKGYDVGYDDGGRGHFQSDHFQLAFKVFPSESSAGG